MVIRQGGKCTGNGNSGTYNSYPISFSNLGTVAVNANANGHYIDNLNITNKSNKGFSVTGSFNGTTWQNTTGSFIAIGI